MPQESLTITIKKSSELYVVAGCALDEANKTVFWYGVRKYPVMSRHLQEETGTKSKTEYIQKFRPPFEESEKYKDFYKGLPEAFEEGKPEAVQRYKPVLSPSTVIIEPTAIEYLKQPTGDPTKDIPIVVEIIKKIRQLIWQYPVAGEFTSLTGLQGPELQEFININVKTAMKKTASLKIIPETVRYISVATGQVFTSESQVKSAIEEYHREPMAVAASNKGGLQMNSVGELLKIADMLDGKGALKEADEILEIVKQMAPAQDAAEICVECEDHKEVNAKVAKIVSTLVKIADSLESKGAFKEAQMADTILQDLKNDIGLPQAFKAPTTNESVVPAVSIPSETVPITESAPAATVEPTQQEVQEAKSPNTPFSQLPESKTEQPAADAPKAVAVEPIKQSQPTFDELTLDEFNTLIDGLRYRHSQGKQRTKYEKIREVATRAKEYKDAYEEWLGHAHKLFEDEPIRLKI
jgi:hypothetical protein